MLAGEPKVLYIDEQDKDVWNDIHPWNVGNNQNREYDGYGGQVISFLLFENIFQVPISTEDVVAYSYGCNDNPFEFNNRFCIQKFSLGR